MAQHSSNAFSLVELSIVLVILGLLTGGILAGQNLIRAAELRSVVAEQEHYLTAVNIFRDKYADLPGDMSNATSYWGAEIAGNCAYANTTGSTNELTCNGDGDGRVISGSAQSASSNEHFRFWQHLANAGLIEGNYTGATNSGTSEYVTTPGVNTPRSKISNAGWWAYNWDSYDGTGAGTVLFAMPDFGNIFMIGGEVPGSYYTGGAFSPKEVWKIDTKLDDGKPGQGKLITFWWDGCTDAATNGSANDDELTAQYLLADTSELCAIVFVDAF